MQPGGGAERGVKDTEDIVRMSNMGLVTFLEGKERE